MSLKHHINLRKGVHANLIDIEKNARAKSLPPEKLLLKLQDYEKFICDIPKIEQNWKETPKTSLEHHLKIFVLKSKLEQIRKIVLQQQLNNAFSRLNVLQFLNVPKSKPKRR